MWNRDADWANDTAVVKINQALRDGVVRSGVQQLRRPRHVDVARRSPAVRKGCRPARGGGPLDLDAGRRSRIAPSGSARSARSPRSSVRTSCRRVSTRATGASWRCATACGRPTTAVPCGAARAPAPAASTVPASRTWCSPGSQRESRRRSACSRRDRLRRRAIATKAMNPAARTTQMTRATRAAVDSGAAHAPPAPGGRCTVAV